MFLASRAISNVIFLVLSVSFALLVLGFSSIASVHVYVCVCVYVRVVGACFWAGGKGGAGVGEWIGERVLEGLISGILNPKPIP